jgi:cytoskeletal protein CcmA (bactofilin family)
MRYNDVVFYNPQSEEQHQHSTCIAKDSKIHIGVFQSTKPLVIEGELDTRELECREDILIEGKVRGNIQGGLLITINGVLDGNVDCYEVVIGPGAVVTGDVRCRDV